MQRRNGRERPRRDTYRQCSRRFTPTASAAPTALTPSGAALARALQRPLDGLETDCCLTADGELVLLHDPLLEVGTTVSGWAHERTAAEIRAGRLRHADGTPSNERPLLLDELLELAPPGATLQLEVKAHANPALARDTARALCERLRDHPARERIEVISFWSGACELAAELGFRARLVIIADWPRRRHKRLSSRAAPGAQPHPRGAANRLLSRPHGIDVLGPPLAESDTAS